VKAPAACPGCENERTQVFQVEGLDCATEVALIEGRLGVLDGVCSVRASAVSGQAIVVHTLPAGSIEAALLQAGFRAHEARLAEKRRASAWSTWWAAGLTVLGFLAGFASRPLAIACYLPAILVGGLPIARKGLVRAKQRALDMNALMTIAVLGAMAIGEWGEGASTVVLFSLAQLLEARSLERARRAISSLLKVAPEEALVIREAGEARVAARDVAVGETIVVVPGERFPLDGSVLGGVSEVDQSPLTGESRPVAKEPGSEVFAGSVNGSGVLTVRVTRAAQETRLARVIRRVEEAQSSRAPSQGFVERFAAVYTPVVVALAFVIAVVPPLIGGGEFQAWIYRALVLLVISCPCALVISTPVSIVSALTAASRRGVLIKGGAHLEALGAVRSLAFDKTGTLTRGAPEVVELITTDGYSGSQVLALASAVESRSGHPLGRALRARAESLGVAAASADSVRAIPGRGVAGLVDGRSVMVGSHRMFDELGLCDHRLDETLKRLESQGQTAVLVGLEGQAGGLVGVIGFSDVPRPEAAQAVGELLAQGVEVSMLTGDNAETARAVAGRLGIGDSRAELLPEDKVAAVQQLQQRAGPVAMVGDGVNDAPALAAASVGIAMGGKSSDAALESADIAVLSDDLTRIPEAVRLGRRTRRVITQNIVLSLLVKAAVLLLALAGHGSLWAAVAADMGASLLVIGNGLRLLHEARE
jgi:Cd2+/Zn2+-exporting ATPase